MRKVLIKMVFGVVAAAFVVAGVARGEGPVAGDLSAGSTEDLIGRLQEEGDIGVTDTQCFLPVPYEQEIFGKVMGYERVTKAPVPVVSPVMRELVKRGVAALPALLEHLTDARPTKIVVRRAVVAREENGVPKPPAIVGKDYTLKTGDLCYVVIWQITGTQGSFAQSLGMSGEMLVHSPVEDDGLAAKIRKDFGGLTAETHRELLEKRWFFTLRTLIFYYPEAGEAHALKVLRQDLYDTPAVWRVLQVDHEDLPKEAAMEKRIAAFRKANGDAEYRGLEETLIRNASMPMSGPNAEKWKPWQVFMGELLKKDFPDADSAHPPELNVTDCSTASEVLAQVGNWPSPEIDGAVSDLLKRLAAMRAVHEPADNNDEEFERWRYQFCRFELGCWCTWRLMPPEGREALFKELQAMSKKFPENPKKGPEALVAFEERYGVFLKGEIARLGVK